MAAVVSAPTPALALAPALVLARDLVRDRTLVRDRVRIPGPVHIQAQDLGLDPDPDPDRIRPARVPAPGRIPTHPRHHRRPRTGTTPSGTPQRSLPG